MAETKNTKKSTQTKTTVKENKTMKKSENEVVVAQEVATQEVAEVKATKNEEKKNTFLTIQEVTKLYEELGVKCYNPEGKGNYRIMGNQKGSSLNVKSTKGYYIYSTDADYELVNSSALKCEDLVVEKGTNSQDKSRPHTIICKTVETLKEVLRIYATNPVNAVPAKTE